MVRAALTLTILASALVATGCGGEAGAVRPLGGLWLGDHLDFALCDGQVRAVQVQDVGCAAVKGGSACARDAAGALAGAWSVSGDEVSITTDTLEIRGVFEADDRFTGTYTFLDPDCCAVTGSLVVRHQSSGTGCEALPDAVVETETDGPDAVDPDASHDGGADAEADGGESPAERALGHVNEARALAGALPLTLDARIVQAAEAHAEFVAKHFQNFEALRMTVHDEDADWSGFTGVKFSDRLKHFGYPFSNGWEIIAFYNDPRLAVRSWLETLYHRVPIVHPNARQIGYGGAKSAVIRVDVMDFAAGYDVEDPRPTVWPPDGLDDVRPAWEGLEDPRPYLPPEGEPGTGGYQEFGYPSGPVITIDFPFVLDFTAESFALTDADGVVVPTQWLGPRQAGDLPAPPPWTEDTHLLFTHALIPFEPLAGGATFTVRFTGTFDGAPYERAWSFTTRAD